MLPWLFVVLVLLNAGLFLWGYQREKSSEPPATPVPEGRYEIQLIGETPEDSQQPTDADVPEAASADEQVSGAQVGETNVVVSTPLGESGPLDGVSVGTTGVAAKVEPAEAAEQPASEPAAGDVPVDDAEPAPEDISESPTVGDTAQAEPATPDEVMPDDVVEETEPVDSRVSELDVNGPVGDDTSESETDGDVGSAESPAEPPAQSPDGLRDDELSAEAPADTSGAHAPASPVGSEPLKEGRAGATMPEQQSEDSR